MKWLEDNSNHYIINLVYMLEEFGEQGRKIMSLIKMEVQKIVLKNIYQCWIVALYVFLSDQLGITVGVVTVA